MRTKQRLEQLEGYARSRRGVIVVIRVQDGRVIDGEFSGMSVKQVRERLRVNDTLIMVKRSDPVGKSGIM